MHVLDVKRHIAVTNIARRLQNGPYLLLSILKQPNQTNHVLNHLVQFNVIRRYVKTDSVHTTHRLNALAAPPGIRV